MFNYFNIFFIHSGATVAILGTQNQDIQIHLDTQIHRYTDRGTGQAFNID